MRDLILSDADIVQRMRARGSEFFDLNQYHIVVMWESMEHDFFDHQEMDAQGRIPIVDRVRQYLTENRYGEVIGTVLSFVIQTDEEEPEIGELPVLLFSTKQDELEFRTPIDLPGDRSWGF